MVLQYAFLIPIYLFRLFFDRKDTIGNLLGFRHVGDNNAITPFGYIVANNIAYENDYFQDSVGNTTSSGTENTVQNNVISLSGDNYIIMTCNIFKDNESLKRADDEMTCNAFRAKLIWREPDRQHAQTSKSTTLLCY